MYKRIYTKMFFEHEVSLLNMFVPVSITGALIWNYEILLKMFVYGSDLGNIKIGKKTINVVSTNGNINIPTLTLPSFDWTVGFFMEDIEHIKDGMNDYDIIMDNRVLCCNILRNKLVCEYMYPEQVDGNKRVRGYIGSLFDQKCYVFTVDNDEPIDYRKFSNLLESELE